MNFRAFGFDVLLIRTILQSFVFFLFQNKRDLIVQEVFTTERQYVETLKMLVEVGQSQLLYIFRCIGQASIVVLQSVTWDGVSCVYNAQRNFTAGSRYSS